MIFINRVTYKELSNAYNLHIYLHSTIHRSYSVSYTIHFIVGRYDSAIDTFNIFKNEITA